MIEVFVNLNEVVGRKNLTPEHDLSGFLASQIRQAWRFFFCLFTVIWRGGHFKTLF